MLSENQEFLHDPNNAGFDGGKYIQTHGLQCGSSHQGNSSV